MNMGKCQSVGEYKKISLRKNPSPGGKLSGNRLFGTDSLTEEECGRQLRDFVNVKTSARVLS